MVKFELNGKTVHCMNGGKELEELPMQLFAQPNGWITYTKEPHGSSTMAGFLESKKVTVSGAEYWLMLSDDKEYLQIYDVRNNSLLCSTDNRWEIEPENRDDESSLMLVWEFLK